MSRLTYDKFEFSFVEWSKVMLWNHLMKAFLQSEKLLLDSLAPAISYVKLNVFLFIGFSHLKHSNDG